MNSMYRFVGNICRMVDLIEIETGVIGDRRYNYDRIRILCDDAVFMEVTGHKRKAKIIMIRAYVYAVKMLVFSDFLKDYDTAQYC